MRRVLTCLAVVLTLAPPAAAPAAPVTVRTVEYESPSVGRRLKCRVLLPAGYESSGKRYPVLYLLHGYSGDYTKWSGSGAEAAAEPYELIVVLPDGANSWYVNWAVSDRGQKNNWEDALVKDLIGYVDAHFRTVASREGRAINGLSLGGYGGITLGLRHPGLFCSIGGTSPALDQARSFARRLKENPDAVVPERKPQDKTNPSIGLEDFDSQEERTPYGRMFTTAAQCEAHDPFSLIRRVPRDTLPHIYLDCGMEDSFLAQNQEFVKILMDLNITFTYAQSPGEHRPAYWRREVRQAIAVQYEILRRNLAAKSEARAGH
jgi:putative tributyrin esterase